MIWCYSLLISCIKLLLFPSYQSTDFDVHRNWLAITHSLPIKEWYYEDTSQWTLDYPPLFAWFQYILSHAGKYFDYNMLDVNKLNYISPNTLLFQRLSVVITDMMYIYGIYECSKIFPKGRRSELILPLLLIPNAGLLMIDHIHFQYNGLMYGILLLSIAKIMQGQELIGAFWFTVLLNMKHIYIYLAPAYFIYLLRNFCFLSKKNSTKEILKSLSIRNTLNLGGVVILVFFITFAPFYSHIDQVLSRLFPFKRGLCHAYWAPNFWSIYNAVDKIAVIVVSKVGLNMNVSTTSASMTGGLVQEFSHSVLPNIKPIVTIMLTGIAMLPAMLKLWTLGPKPNNFIRCIVLCALTSFLFGWHVHEKAILMAIIPLSVLAVIEPADAKVFLLLSTVGHYSLFPLLFPSSLIFIKLLILVIHSYYAFYSLYSLYPFQFCKFTFPLLNSIESVYLLGLIPLFVYHHFIHSYLSFTQHLPFLPLMMTSIYCGIGVLYCWIKYYILFFIIKCK